MNAPGALLVATLVALPAQSQTELPVKALIVDYEGGPLRIFQNDARYGPNGTLFTAGEVGQRRNLYLSQRLSFELRFSRRHAAVLLYAPLEVTTRAVLPGEVVFREQTFAQGATVDHRYLFDGYRGSYLFRALDLERWNLDIGGSLQVRNAAVSFTDRVTEAFAVESDIGLVFALKARGRYVAGWGGYALLDVDAISTFGLFGAGGSLVDAALSLGLPLTASTDFFVRVRYVGGGADVPDRDLYNQAHFGSATAGLRIDLARLL